MAQVKVNWSLISTPQNTRMVNATELEKVTNYFELVNSNNPNRLYIDLDGKYDNDDFDVVHSNILKQLTTYDAAVMTASKRPKLSYRLTFPTIAFRDIKKMKEYALSLTFPEHIQIDPSVYRKSETSKMRCVNAYKTETETDRYFKLVKGTIEETIIGNVLPGSTYYDDPKIDELLQILKKLDRQRFESYDEWLNLAFIFKNEGYPMEIFDHYSRNSDKYDCQKNHQIIKDLKPRPDGFGKGTLMWWLKEDDAPKFKEIVVTNQAESDYFWEFASYRFTHLDLAEDYYARFHENLVVSHDSGWYEYNRYNVLVKCGHKFFGSLLRKVGSYYQDRLNYHRNKLTPKDDHYKERIRIYNDCYKKVTSSHFRKGLGEDLTACYLVDGIDEKMDCNYKLLPFIDRVYDFTIGDFRDIRKDDYITTTLDYKAPVTSNPEIRSHLTKIISNLFANKEIAEYWWKSTALSIFTNRFESLYIHTGSGGNGKGLTTSMLEKCLGTFFYTGDSGFLTSEYKGGSFNSTLAKARHSRYLLITEPGTGFRNDLNVDFVKSITGGDTITTRDVGKANISYKPHFTVFLQCNSLPSLYKLDGGIKRRLKVIDFPFNFVDDPVRPNDRKRDSSLKELVLSNEYRDEFMLMLLEIAGENRDLNFIPLPEEIDANLNSYFDDNDPIKPFIKHAPGESIRTEEFRKKYENKTGNSISSKKLIEYMKYHDVKIVKKMGFRSLCDIQFYDEI